MTSLLLTLFLSWPGSVDASDFLRPQFGSQPLGKENQMWVSHGDRCPVCGMKVIRYPKFYCAIQLKDSSTFYFCTSGCMIRSWLHPKIHLGSERHMLELPVVQDYFTGRHIDARTIVFVYGSDIIGPMGPAFVPVQPGAHLAAFKKRHGGNIPFLLSELTSKQFCEMTGRQCE